MHPDKFLGRVSNPDVPELSDEQKKERLASIGMMIADKRKEAMDARKASGIEEVWLACEEAYLGIDDMNRHEFAKASWAKPTSINGPLMSNRVPNQVNRSNVYVRLSSRYVDHASAKLSEIILPIDDKPFSFEPTPVPDLIKQADDLTPIIDEMTGKPVMREVRPDEVPQQASQPSQQAPQQPDQQPPAPGQPPQQPQMTPLTVADRAKVLMGKASDMADKAETRIYDWMVEGKYTSEIRKVIKDAARIGVGVLKGPIPDISTSKAMTKVPDGVALQIKQEIKPVVKWVDPWNFFPADGCGENIADGDNLERDFLSEKALKALKNQEGYLSDQIDAVIEEGPGKIYSEGVSPNEKKGKKRYEIWYYYGTMSKEDVNIAIQDPELKKGIEKYEDVNVVATLVNDTVIRVILNPLESGEAPYHAMSWSRRPGFWAGVGVAEMMTMPQRTCNAATRALLNNAGVTCGPQIVIDELGIRPADGNWTLTPNKIWYKTEDSTSDDVRKLFMSVVFPSVQQELMAIIEYSMKLAEESTGIPLITQGQTGPSTPETFGAAELQDNNAHTWIRSIAYSFDEQITEPLVNAYYEWLLLDPDVPDDEKGDFKINARGSIVMVERAIQEQVFLGLLNMAGNPAFKLDPSKAIEEYLKSKRIDPRKVQYSEEDQQKMEQQPPQPPIQIAVEQLKGQNALQLQQAKSQAELQQIAAEAQQEQQALQNGGTTPHMAAAISRVEQERIRAETAQTVEASRANAELARADKEMMIARQNGEFDIQKLQLQRDLALLDYANKRQLNLDQVKAELARTAMDNSTKRDLAEAEIQLAQNEGDKDRAHDMDKHITSLVKDEVSTPDTP